MYVYIYDAVTGKKRYNKTLINIEKKITDLGLNGKIIRLEGISNAQKIIQDEIKYGVKTVVVVGTDETVNTALNAIMNTSENKEDAPALAIIPIKEKDNAIAGALGIKGPLNGCDVLLARRVERITIPQINNTFFLSQINTQSPDVQLQIQEGFSIEMTNPGELNIINFPLEKQSQKDLHINPKNKLLKLLIHPFKKESKNINYSVFSLQKLSVNQTSKPVIVDNCLHIDAPAEIKTTSHKIDIIVGKNRNF